MDFHNSFLSVFRAVFMQPKLFGYGKCNVKFPDQFSFSTKPLDSPDMCASIFSLAQHLRHFRLFIRIYFAYLSKQIYC